MTGPATDEQRCDHKGARLLADGCKWCRQCETVIKGPDCAWPRFSETPVAGPGKGQPQ